MGNKLQDKTKAQNNRIAIKLVTSGNSEIKSRFTECARRLKRTIEREMKFVSTSGEASPRQVGQMASLDEINDVIWIRAVSNEDVLPCKSLIQLAAEQSKVANEVLVVVNPSPMMPVI